MEILAPKVLITGVTGYLGSRVLESLLHNGSFQVKGTVRSLSNEAKIAPLQKAFGDQMKTVELVEADLLDPQSLDEAIKGCQYVIHTASPFMIGSPNDENDLLGPAVEGTRAVLEACRKHKIQRLIVTSSTASVVTDDLNGHTYTEADWPEITDQIGAYKKSKIMAEKLCWDYQNSLPEDEKFELVTLQPSLIVGPTLTTQPFASQDLLT